MTGARGTWALLCAVLAGCPDTEVGSVADGAVAPCDPATCESGLCALAGEALLGQRACKPLAEVLYVSAAVGCDARGGGTRAAPLCSLDVALTLVSGRQVIALLPGTHRIAAAPSRPVEIYGIPDATLTGAKGAEVVALSGTRLLLADLTLDATSHSPGLSCSQGGALELVRVTVQGASGVGLSAQDCKVLLREATLRDNQDGALLLLRTRYDVIESRFLDNRSTDHAAVRISADSDGSFRRCDVRCNRVTRGLPGGVYCIGGMKDLINVSLCGNQAQGDQQVSNCTLVQSSVAATCQPAVCKP